MTPTPFVLAVALVATTAHCREQRVQPAPPPTGSGVPEARVSPPDGGGAAPCAPAPGDAAGGAEERGGLEDARNDPAVVGWARTALACPWSPAGLSIRCAGYAGWLDHLKSGEGDHDATLVALVEDADVRVRFLGAAALARRGRSYRRAADLAGRLVRAAEAEGAPVVAAQLGSVLARVDLVGTGLAARVRALVTGHALPALRAGLIGDLLVEGGAGWFDLTRERARRDPAREVRLAALTAFWIGGAERAEEVCALWRDHIADADVKVAEKAAYLLSFWGRCQDDFGALQAEQARRAAAGEMTWAYFASVEYVARDDRARRKVKEAAVDIARAVVGATTNPWAARTRALEFIAARDRGARDFIARFTDDEVDIVKSKAAELLAELK